MAREKIEEKVEVKVEEKSAQERYNDILLSDVHVALSGNLCRKCPRNPRQYELRYHTKLGVSSQGKDLILEKIDYICPDCGYMESYVKNIKQIRLLLEVK